MGSFGLTQWELAGEKLVLHVIMMSFYFFPGNDIAFSMGRVSGSGMIFSRFYHRTYVLVKSVL